MKKALAILLVLSAVTAVIFAEDAKTYGNDAAIAVSGNATLTWGVDFENENATGFKNETEWKISIPLLSKQTLSHKGEGANYAEINIVDAQYYIEGAQDQGTGNGTDNNKDFVAGKGDKKIDSVNAKLHFGNVYVTVAGKPSLKSNSAEIWEPIKSDGYYDDDKEGKLIRFEPGVEAFGTKVGYIGSNYEVAGKIVSKNAWDGASDSDNKNKYGFGADVSFTPSDMITVAGTANYANWKSATVTDKDGKYLEGIASFGGKVVAKPVEGLTATAAFDAGNEYVNEKLERTIAYDALATVKYSFIEGGMYYASAFTPFTSANLQPGKAGDTDNKLSQSDTFPGSSFVSSFNSDLAAKIGDAAFYAKVTDGGFVPNLTASATVIVMKPFSAWNKVVCLDGKKAQVPVVGAVAASYKYATTDVNYFKPFVDVWFQNDMDKNAVLGGSNAFQTAYDLGVEYGLFANTTVTAKLAAGDTDTKNHQMMLLTKTAAADSGRFTLAAKVTY